MYTYLKCVLEYLVEKYSGTKDKIIKNVFFFFLVKVTFKYIFFKNKICFIFKLLNKKHFF